jgi:hypothetical protein
VAGLAVVLALAEVTGAAPLVTLVVVVAVPGSFLLSARLSAAVFGQERIVFFEKALIALVATGIVLRELGQGVRAGLDLTMLGIGTFLALGRIGCLMVGCCHGRPCRWGIRYGVAHARAGFPWYYVGRRLFPLQLVDGVTSLALVVAGVAAATSPHAPGALAAGWLFGYGAVRFFEEIFRGDAVRPLWLGLSEAQWTAALLTSGLAWLGPPSAPWPWLGPVVAPLLGASAIILALASRFLTRSAWGITSPWHVEEVNRTLVQLRPGGAPLVTSQGLHVSMHRLRASRRVRDYLLSFPDRPLSPRVVTALSEHVRFAQAPDEQAEIVSGATPGLVHVLVKLV